MTEPAISAVILARGLGTRMRKADPAARIADDEARVADSGLKGMIPIDRPFLDYLLSALADAGFRRVCLVIGPEHDVVRDYYGNRETPRRIALEFAIQSEPLGTADAVLAAESFAADRAFAVLNSDNYYPARALEALRLAPAPALIGFERSALLDGNVPADRVTRFGELEVTPDNHLVRIKVAGSSEAIGPIYASMNCWLFTPEIFEACRAVKTSPRGELELPRAVQLGIDTMGMRFTVVKMREKVLDLSTRADIATVRDALRGVRVNL